MMYRLALTLTIATLMSAPTLAGDAAKGAKIYRKCVSCHMIGDKAKHRIGPHLNDIIGRAIAGASDYQYSKGMKAFAVSEKVWSEENLAAYLANPRKTVKGTRMAFVGLRKEKDQQDVIAYLKKAAQ